VDVGLIEHVAKTPPKAAVSLKKRSPNQNSTMGW